MISRILQVLSFHQKVLSLSSSFPSPLSFSWVSGAGRSHKPDRSVSLGAKKSAVVGSSMDGWLSVVSSAPIASTKCCWRGLQLGWVSQKCYHDNGHELGSTIGVLLHQRDKCVCVCEFSFRKSSTDPNEHRYLALASSLKKPVVPSIIPHFQRCCVGIHQGQAEPDDIEVVRRATPKFRDTRHPKLTHVDMAQATSMPEIGDSWTWMQSG